jgi:hypothetical protein
LPSALSTSRLKLPRYSSTLRDRLDGSKIERIFSITSVSCPERGSKETTPDNVGDKLSRENIIIRIVNGGSNMPAFGNSLKPEEIDALVAFLQSRKRPLRAQDQSSMAQN